ncbi:hypothetical protein PFISCL1PPCAC_25893, partial [Pristionchus fissidentatus]
ATGNAYPDVVVQEVAKRVDYSTIKKMKLVNRSFRTALADPLLWINLCERDQRTLPSREFRKSLAQHALNDESCIGKLDFERIWVLDPFRSNLVPPMLPTLEEMKWEYGWRFSEPPMGKQDLSMIVEEIPVGEHPEISRCIATSYTWGQRTLTIDLVDEGVPEWMLDHVRPRIVISELVRPHPDSSATYRMHAILLREGEQFHPCGYGPSQLQLTGINWRNGSSAQWVRVGVTFEDYPMGIRKIAVRSEGMDTQYQRDRNYGAKYANLQIRVEAPEKFRWLGEDDFTGFEKPGRGASKRSADPIEPPWMLRKRI